MRRLAINRGYAFLTPEERFRLIMAALARGDKSEQTRVASTSKRIAISMGDHAPYGDAFLDLSLHAFLELLDHAAAFEQAAWWVTASRLERAGAARASRPRAANDADAPDPWFVQYAYAAGYVLRTCGDAWQRFCEDIDVPPFVFWERLPGYERARDVLAEVEKASYTADEFWTWLHSVQPAGEIELTELRHTVPNIVERHRLMYEHLVQSWSGRKS